MPDFLCASGDPDQPGVPHPRVIDGAAQDRRLGAVVLNRLTAVDMRRLGMPPLPQRETAEIVADPAVRRVYLGERFSL